MEINEIVAISQYTLKSLAFEHYILQITLHNLHLYLLIVGLGQCANWWKQTSVTRYARVGFLPVLGSSKLLRFDGGPLELDGFTFSLMIRASNSARLSWNKLLDPDVNFHSDENDDDIRSKHWFCHINEMPEYFLVPVLCLAWYLIQW